MRCLHIFLALVCLTVGVFADGSGAISYAMEQRFEALVGRIKTLEGREHATQTRMADMEAAFSKREGELVARITELENKEASSSGPVRRAPNVAAGPPRSPVAFYAIGPDYDFSRMAANQSIVYAPPTTNIGQAFNHASGRFVTPVGGTYVFSVTVCAKLNNNNNFNVVHNGAIVAKLFVGPTLSQTSQTVVLDMAVGDVMGVVSGRPDNAVYGSSYTSISGFLLYDTTRAVLTGK